MVPGLVVAEFGEGIEVDGYGGFAVDEVEGNGGGEDVEDDEPELEVVGYHGL